MAQGTLSDALGWPEWKRNPKWRGDIDTYKKYLYIYVQNIYMYIWLIHFAVFCISFTRN